MSGRQFEFRTPWLDPQNREQSRRDGAAPKSRGPRSEPARPSGARSGVAPTGGARTQAPSGPKARTGVPPWVAIAGGVAGVVFVGALMLAVGGNKEAIGVIFTGPLCVGITWYVARRLAILDRNPEIVPILMGAVCLKLIGALIRYWVASGVYGTGDFFDYDKWGRRVASGLRHGHLISTPGRLAGTNFMRLVTGFIYLATPSRMLSGFLVYGFLSFVGLIFFWRAYRVAISDTYDITYLKWIVLLPSLVYWPSAIGKDAFMVLAAGIAAWGAACLLSDRVTVGVVGLSLGILGMVMVRPHFAMAVCGGLGLAVLFRRNRGGFMRSIVSFAFVIGIGLVVANSASSFFGIQAFNQKSIQQTLTDASAQTGQGGSQFSPVIVNSPVKLPLAAVTVFYRPFPWETGSPQELLTALEGVVLIGLTVRSVRRSRLALRSARTYPYLLYCLGALIVFVVAFSGFSNFGILARERTVIQPLFLVFLSLPANFNELKPGTKGTKGPMRAPARAARRRAA